MNKTEIYHLLKQKNIWHTITEHQAVFHMSQLSDTALSHPECEAKNLFVRDDKKRNYYLITVKGDKRVNLKKFRQKNDTRPLSFASEKELMEQLDLLTGAVSPLGLLNHANCMVQYFLDETFLESPGLINIHPNDNTATVCMRTEDLILLLKEHGISIQITSIAADNAESNAMKRNDNSSSCMSKIIFQQNLHSTDS